MPLLRRAALRKVGIEEIKAETMDAEKFIERQVRELKKTVGNGLAVNALSGGVDSSVVTALGHRTLGKRLKTYFINNGLMRKNEPQQVGGTQWKKGNPSLRVTPYPLFSGNGEDKPK